MTGGGQRGLCVTPLEVICCDVSACDVFSNIRGFIEDVVLSLSFGVLLWSVCVWLCLLSGCCLLLVACPSGRPPGLLISASISCRKACLAAYPRLLETQRLSPAHCGALEGGLEGVYAAILYRDA